MKAFLDNDFLLQNDFAKTLYHEYAQKMPILDYHNHLPPEMLANDVKFHNATQAWLYGDHYKWRAMRTLGIQEQFITGNAPDKEKFNQWAYTVPYTMRNPLYHWTHLELQRYFNITEPLTLENAAKTYERVNEHLQGQSYSCQGLVTKMNVEYLCTTDDPTDDLIHHQKLAKSDFKTKVSTAFRPDNAIFMEAPGFLDYMERLSAAADVVIDSFKSLCLALEKRIAYFHTNGCRIADHGLPHMYFKPVTESELHKIFNKKMDNKPLSPDEMDGFKSALLLFLSKQYHKHDWVQQFHLGALRNNSDRMLMQLGANTGWDSIGDWPQAENLSKFLNQLDSNDQLCKTIIYNLNPRDNEVMASMIGNFNDGSLRGKIQFGSGWWFLDQKDGMEKQLNALSNIGMLSCFVGMLTDSRSFLSFPRHEYFRRILCNLFGKDIADGELPNDTKWIGQIVQDICYHNAKAYFNL
jgi:glucuronate isomerase